MRRSVTPSSPPALAMTTLLTVLAISMSPAAASGASTRSEPAGVRAMAEVLAAVARDLLIVERHPVVGLFSGAVDSDAIRVSRADSHGVTTLLLSERLLDLPPPAAE